MEINNFLKDRLEKDKNIDLIEIVPEFLLNNIEIINELNKIDKEHLNDLFTGIFLALNQLGEKLFDNNTNNTLIEEFKIKIKNYNDKTEFSVNIINDLIFSDLITEMHLEFKENGLKPFYNEKAKQKKTIQSKI